jgi:plasmid segregation protein ParM
METLNIQSYDDGYGDGKSSSGLKTIRIPNAYADYMPKPEKDFEDDGLKANNGYTNPLYDYISYKGSEGEFIVGQSALSQSMDINWYGGDDKHTDLGFPIMLKTNLGLLAETESSVVDLLVMGLPCDKDNLTRRQILHEKVVRQHNVELELANGSKLNRTIHVKNLIVKKQPFGSFCDILLDEHGNVVDRELANGFVVVADIGSRTFNLYVLNKMEEVPELIDTSNNGMYTSYMRVGRFIKNKAGFNIPTGKLPLVVKDETFHQYDLTEVINNSHMKLAHEIKSFMDTKLVNAYGYVSHIIFTGGGAEVLKTHLKNLFINRSNLIFLDRYATARGLRKYGLFKAKKMFPNFNPQPIMRGEPIPVKVVNRHVQSR